MGFVKSIYKLSFPQISSMNLKGMITFGMVVERSLINSVDTYSSISYILSVFKTGTFQSFCNIGINQNIAKYDSVTENENIISSQGNESSFLSPHIPLNKNHKLKQLKFVMFCLGRETICNTSCNLLKVSGKWLPGNCRLGRERECISSEGRGKLVAHQFQILEKSFEIFSELIMHILYLSSSTFPRMI